jgi:hypothetical protein
MNGCSKTQYRPEYTTFTSLPPFRVSPIPPPSRRGNHPGTVRARSTSTTILSQAHVQQNQAVNASHNTAPHRCPSTFRPSARRYASFSWSSVSNCTKAKPRDLPSFPVTIFACPTPRHKDHTRTATPNPDPAGHHLDNCAEFTKFSSQLLLGRVVRKSADKQRLHRIWSGVAVFLRLICGHKPHISMVSSS